MIISHRHRFIFVAIPKTGTHSIRRALRPHLGPGDHEQVALFVERRLPYETLAGLRHGHLSLSQVRPFVGEEVFASYFKFAFVRNPFDRFISFCAFTSRDSDAFQRDPRAVMRQVLARPPLDRILFAPQHTFIVGDDGSILADEVGRAEDMQGTYERYCRRLGLASITLERVNGSIRGDYRAYFDQELIDRVARLYARDLELFEYRFGDAAG